MKPDGTDNYEKWCEEWRLRFLDMDQRELLKRLPELKEEGGYLTLRHFGRKFAVGRRDGRITAPEDDAPVLRNEKLNIYTLFGYVKAGARLTGEWVPFEKLKNTSPFAKAFRNGVTEPFARMFDGRSGALEQACLSLGGKKLPWSDMGYELSAFECIPVRFLFWEGDEEFPAQGNLLFDAGATDFIHGESIVTIASVGLSRLAGAAGVPMDSAAFVNV